MENKFTFLCFVIFFAGKDVHAQTQWSRWTDCDKACDTGFQNRARECPSGDSSCTVIETRKCNEFSCNMTTMSSSSSKTASPPTLPLMTLPLSSLAGLTTQSDVQEQSSELTTLLTKPAPQNARSTTTSSTTTTTTTMATTLNTKSGSTPLHLNFLIASVLFWYMI